MDKAIQYLQAKHSWLTYAEAFALIMDSYRRHNPENKYSNMTKTLIDMDISIFARESRNQLCNRLAIIQEWC
jgi:hypothetical protein